MAETIGDRVRRRRRAMGITQGDLGRAAGLSRQSISGIEHGRQQPSRSALRSLARVLEVSPRYLEFGPGTDVEAGATDMPSVVYSHLTGGRTGDLPPAVLAHLERVISWRIAEQMAQLRRELLGESADSTGRNTDESGGSGE